jgi:hypothetical protein
LVEFQTMYAEQALVAVVRVTEIALLEVVPEPGENVTPTAGRT